MELAIAVGTVLAIIGGALIYVSRKRARIRWQFSPPDHELIIANLGGHDILGFELLPNGQIAGAPGRRIHGPLTGLQNPFAVALDHQNRIWVANLGLWPGQPNNEPSITLYESNANGNASPIRTIPKLWFLFSSNLHNPVAIAMRPFPENLLVADAVLRSVFEFEIASGHDLPTGGIQGPQTITTPSGIGLDLAGRIYVAERNPDGDAILVFTVQAHQFVNASPGASIFGPATGLNAPAHITLDTQDQLFVVNRGTLPNLDASITVYQAGATGNVQAIRTIQGPATTLVNPHGIAVDGDGRVFVSRQNSVLVFEAGATGNVAPERNVNHPDISNPIGLAVR